MDPVDLVALTRALVDIDSTTGREGEAGAGCADYLARARLVGRRAAVDDTRFNVLANLGASAAQVVFSTHFDCVPPFFPSRIEGDELYGRGSCDAKGILAAQVAAAEQLARGGESRVGLLFVVGEERGSDGARVANEAASRGCRFLINGEPTDNRLGRPRAASCGSSCARPAGPRTRRFPSSASRRSTSCSTRCPAAFDHAARRSGPRRTPTTPSASLPAASRRTSCRRRPTPK